MVGNAANSSVRWVNIAASNTMIDKAILKVNNRSSMNAGSGSTIIDKINRIKIGPGKDLPLCRFQVSGRRSIADDYSWVGFSLINPGLPAPEDE